MTIEVEYDSFGRIACSDAHNRGRQLYKTQFTYDGVGRIARRAELVDGTETLYDYI